MPMARRQALFVQSVSVAAISIVAVLALPAPLLAQTQRPCNPTPYYDAQGMFHAADIGCVAATSTPRTAAPTATPRPGQPTPTAVSQPQLVQAEPVATVQAETVQPVEPAPDQPAVGPAVPDTAGDVSVFFHVYQLAVPGAVWTVEDMAAQTRTTYAESGVPATGGIAIRPDGTYVWNNTWEDRVIEGVWEATGDAGFPIRLLAAEGGRDWGLGLDRTGYSQDGTGIIMWGGESLADEYRGTLVE